MSVGPGVPTSTPGLTGPRIGGNHGGPQSSSDILEPEFGNYDIWFLNHQAKWFLAHADPRHAPGYEHHPKLIRELFAHVPEPLRAKLEWPGPDEPPGQ